MLGNVKSTIKNSIIYGLGNITTKIVGFILLPLYTNYLSTADYGILGLLEISTTVIISVFGLSIYQAFFRWYYDKNYELKQKSLFYTTLCFLVVISLFMIICLMPFSGKISYLLFNSSNYYYLIQLMIISAALDIIIQGPNTLIRLQEKPILFTVSNITKLTFSMFFTIWFISYLKFKIEGIFYAQIIGQLVYLLMVSRFVFRNIQVVFERLALKNMIIFAVPLMFSSISVLLLNLSDRYLLKIFGTLSDVGIYSLGYKMANTIQIFIITSVNLALSPLIFRMMDKPDNKRFYSKILTYYVFGLMFFVLGISMFGKEVIKVIVSRQDYWNSFKVIPILSFAILFNAMKDMAITGLHVKKKTKTLASIIFVLAIINVLFNIVLINFLGSIGSAISSLISQFLFFVIVMHFAQKAYYIPYEFKKIYLMCLIGITLVIISFFANDLYLPLRLGIKLLLILSFPFILWLTKFYEPVELDAIKNGFNKWKNPMLWKSNINNVLNRNKNGI